MRKGRKNSAESSTMENAVANDIAPCPYCTSAQPMPAATPPKAIRSMTVMELSCMRKRRMVARRNPSASAFMASCARSSAENTLSVVRPWMFSRNVAPRSA